jgi:hypothetical protein
MLEEQALAAMKEMVAKNPNGDGTPFCVMSAAISLKRIADALEKTTAKCTGSHHCPSCGHEITI